MPRVRDCKWDGFSAGLRPRGFIRSRLRVGRSYILPYLYLSPVDLDLLINVPLTVDPSEIFKYDWNLFCENKEQIESDPEVHTEGQGLIEVGNIMFTYQKAHWWDMGKVEKIFSKQGIVTDIEKPAIMTKAGTIYKQGAVNLGLLSIPGRYKIKMRLTNGAGTIVSDYGTRIQFTVTDADNFHINILLIGYTIVGGIIGGAIGAFITFMVKGG